MATQKKTTPSDATSAPRDTAAPEPQVLVRFLKHTQVSQCGGVFAAHSTTTLPQTTAQALVAAGFATIIGV